MDLIRDAAGGFTIDLLRDLAKGFLRQIEELTSKTRLENGLST
jgi:hypothetical protein